VRGLLCPTQGYHFVQKGLVKMDEGITDKELIYINDNIVGRTHRPLYKGFSRSMIQYSSSDKASVTIIRTMLVSVFEKKGKKGEEKMKGGGELV
jgi:hypothetical protein